MAKSEPKPEAPALEPVDSNARTVQSAHPGPIHVAGRWVYPGQQPMVVDDAFRAAAKAVGRVAILQAA